MYTVSTSMFFWFVSLFTWRSVISDWWTFLGHYFCHKKPKDQRLIPFYVQNDFGPVQEVILDTFQLFWTGANVFEMVQSVKFSSENLFLVQNNLNGSNTIWTMSKIVFGLNGRTKHKWNKNFFSKIKLKKWTQSGKTHDQK